MAAAGAAVAAAVGKVVTAELDAPTQHRLIGEAITATERETV